MRGRSSAWWFVVIGVIFIVVASLAFLLWPQEGDLEPSSDASATSVSVAGS